MYVVGDEQPVGSCFHKNRRTQLYILNKQAPSDKSLSPPGLHGCIENKMLCTMIS